MKPWIVILVLGFAGCSVGPDYQPPEVQWPDTWRSLDTASKTLGATDRTVPKPDLSKWWKSFNDPLLDRMLELAFTDNLSLKMALTRIEQARAEWRANRSALFPKVGVNAVAAGVDNFLTRSIQSTGTGAFFLTGFDALWEIDLFGRLHRKLESAEAHVTVSVEDYKQTWIVLASEVARVYTLYRKLQLQERITLSNLEVQKKSLALTQSLFEEGVGDRFDVERAAAEVEQTASTLPQLQGQRADMQFQLEVLLGMKPGGLQIRLMQEGAIPFAGTSGVLLTRPSDTLRWRPDVLASERKLAAATALQGAAIAELFPKVSIAAFAGLQNTDLESLFRSAAFSWASGSAVMQPIFNFGRIRAGIDLADARQQEALLAYEALLLRSFQETESAMTQWLKEMKRYASLEKSVEHLRIALSLADLRYREGVSTFLDVLDAQRVLYSEELALADSRAMTTLYLIALYKALGGDGQFEMPSREEPLRPWG